LIDNHKLTVLKGGMNFDQICHQHELASKNALKWASEYDINNVREFWLGYANKIFNQLFFWVRRVKVSNNSHACLRLVYIYIDGLLKEEKKIIEKLKWWLA